MGTAPATSRRRWEKRRFFWITEETSKQAGAKWSEQMTERSLPPYQSARRPRTKRSHSSRTARSLGKRNSDFPDLVVLPQWAATQRAGIAATSASARPRAPSRGDAVPLRQSARRGASSGPLPPAPGSAELGPHRGVRGARVSASARSQRSSPESGGPPAVGSKFRAGRAEVGRKEERTGSGGCHSYRGGRPPPRLLTPTHPLRLYEARKVGRGNADAPDPGKHHRRLYRPGWPVDLGEDQTGSGRLHGNP